jgi:NarL family two-component system response regulator LiaR
MVTEGPDGGSTARSTVRLAIVNDYEVVVRGLAHMLDRFEDLEVVELDTTTEVQAPVDVALFDTYAKAEADNGEVQALVEHPQVKHVVVYSWNLDHALQRRVIDNGVSGYLSKSMTSDELAEALRRVAEGKVVESSSVHDDEEAGRPADSDTRAEGDWPGREHGLTARESEVLALITQGLSNQDIAERTHLSINSVKTYIRHAYHKIGVTSRSRAVLWGIDHGFRPDSIRVQR